MCDVRGMMMYFLMFVVRSCLHSETVSTIGRQKEGNVFSLGGHFPVSYEPKWVFTRTRFQFSRTNQLAHTILYVQRD